MYTRCKSVDIFLVNILQLSPPYFLPIVELVKSPWIREDLLARALHIVNAIGQNPVVVHKERLGHVLSRLHNAIFMEAYKLVRVGKSMNIVASLLT